MSHLWRYAGGQAIALISVGLIVNACLAGTKGNSVAYIGCSNGEIVKIDLDTLEEVKRKAPGFSLWTCAIEVSQDRRWLYGFGSYGMVLAKVDLHNWELVKSISPGDTNNPLHGLPTQCFLLTPDGRKIFAHEAWNKTTVIDANSLKVMDQIGVQVLSGVWTKRAVFSLDGRLLYSARGDTIFVTDVTTNSLRTRIEVPEEFGRHIRDLTLSEDGTQLYLLVAPLEKPEEFLLAYEIPHGDLHLVGKVVGTQFVGGPVDGKLFVYGARRELSFRKGRPYYTFVCTQETFVVDLQRGSIVEKIPFPDLKEVVDIDEQELVGVTKHGCLEVRDSYGRERFIGYGLVRMSPDGKKLLFGVSTGNAAEAGFLVIQDVDTGSVLKKIPLGASVADIAFRAQPQ